MSLLRTSLIPHTLHLATNYQHRRNAVVKPFPSVVLSQKPDPPKPKPKPRSTSRRRKPEPPKPKPTAAKEPEPEASASFPTPKPRKPRRGRRSEAAAVEDYVRDRLEQTFAAMKEQNPELFENRDKIFKQRAVDNDDDDDDDDDAEAGNGGAKEKEMVVEEESKEWPLDTDVGWGIRASEYFEKHPIKNVVGEDGFEIDWEGEIEDNWVKEINCLEWESFAFHPSPLVVLVFERYNRASENWKALKELEKAVKVYWDAKDRLPPRSVKVDINIERDLAYALKVKEGPQILFLRGNRILYREKEFRTADELVHMIAHFYYNAKRPSWIDASAVSRPYC